MIRSNVKFASSGLAFIVLAGLAGLVGFLIVYHYASFERPTERFAIVIDAGSTQTRSSLYSISLSPLPEQPDSSASASLVADQHAGPPVSELVRVRELAGCVNGGPLATVGGPADANKLLGKCLSKFAQKITLLDFATQSSLYDMLLMNPEDANNEGDEYLADGLEADELDRRLALLNHRVNSVTHVHLGATAGMRALELLEPQEAARKIHWAKEAIAANSGSTNSSSSSSLPSATHAGGLIMNPGFVGIIEGTSEASFGWLSVNFVCDILRIQAGESMATIKSNIAFQLESVNSIGTLELGGASAQMAFQLAGNQNGLVLLNGSMQTSSLELFGNSYSLATRSDLCLGMSQAILRTNYILLRAHFEASSNATNQKVFELENPCQQNGSRISPTTMIDSILKGACLESSSQDQEAPGEKFKQFVAAPATQQLLSRMQLIGTGNVDACEQLLSRLIEPEKCKEFFSLCPQSENKQAPPAKAMPFVTISGYNKALQVLNLKPVIVAAQSDETERMIETKLGGWPIDYGEFEQKTRAFCSLDVRQLAAKYPQMVARFHAVNCLQLVYIRRLLVDFYQFKPDTSSWNQLRFLLFPVEAKKSNTQQAASGDIGWTLGLLLNATSFELTTESNSSRVGEYAVHHGASVAFLIRTIVLLVIGCVFIAAALVVCGLVMARRKCRSAYICHSDQTVTNPQRMSPKGSL